MDTAKGVPNIIAAEQHAIPFRVIFYEHLERLKSDLRDAWCEYAQSLARQRVVQCDRLAELRCQWASLTANTEEELQQSEAAYTDLQLAKLRHEEPDKVAELERACSEADVPLKRLLHSLDGTALCLSGGGIRSASFCLGVIQGLARFSRANYPGLTTVGGKPLLEELDYLSTVSGGGYIGSWLMAWVTRQGKDKQAYENVIKALSEEQLTTSADPAPGTIRHLREYASFLAPKLGLSVDAWTLGAIVLRNLVVNWLLVVPLLLAAVAAPQVLRYGMIAAAKWLPSHCWANVLIPVLTSLVFIFAAIVAVRSMPSRALGEICSTISRPGWFLAAALLGSVLLVEIGLEHCSNDGWHWWWFGYLGSIGLICFSAISVSAARNYARVARKSASVAQDSATNLWLARFWCLVGTIIVSLVTAAILEGLAMGANHFVAEAKNDIVVVFGVPTVLAVLILGSSLLSAFLVDFESETDREWWGRAGGILISIIAGWIGAELIIVYLPNGLNRGWHLWVGAAGGVMGLLGTIAGWSGQTSSGSQPVKASQVTSLGQFLSKYHLIVPGLCTAGILVILAEMSVFETWLISLPFSSVSHLVRAHFAILSLAIAVGGLASLVININAFSLHGMYRMRLMRTFLGASNARRNSDPFTNFDNNDNLREEELPVCTGVPLHLINTALNLVGTKDLAWQQRKAESFTFSPLHCGAWRIGYVPTSSYAGDRGPTLATAMAISGAAFNPNMGYHSSALVTFLMTVFNARLGWWLPNPARAEVRKGGLTSKSAKFLRQNSPDLALEPLFSEAFGKTNDTARWIELTDGGHFENLGLYEMVLRRCRRIIVVDAGADPDLQFEDLGNAIRKIRIDLGISISFKPELPIRKGNPQGNPYCAVGEINYADVDPGAEIGTIIYIKSVLKHDGFDEPPDVRQYAATHPSFPAETTLDQFFNESQFESYRNLGSFAVDQIVEGGLDFAPANSDVSMDSFIALAKLYAV